MDLQTLLSDPPRLHMAAGQQLTSFMISQDMLTFLDQHIQPGWHTLETGAGTSTIMFAMKRAHHIAIAPDAGLMDRIRAYCQEQDIPTEDLTLMVKGSQDALPGLDVADLDLVLIDGLHTFPLPFIDWYYTAEKLKIGGLLIVDDTHLWTGRVLQEFLDAESAWELVTQFASSVVFAKRAANVHAGWWKDQPYVVAHNDSGYFKRYYARDRRAEALDLLRRGQWITLGKRAIRYLFSRRSNS
ncbi:MAG: class I SAM-dependent methyltransferase [Anaerolineae bacterium]|nr:class I SAM-dependent methyltransferase [Anaerolineae bacterium]